MTDLIFFGFTLPGRWAPRRRIAALAISVATAVFVPSAFAQTGEWVWTDGSSVGYGPDVYGILGVPAAANTPGARESSVSWTDSKGNLWLFGGSAGASGHNSNIHFNDLWEYNPATNQWTWMSGSDSTTPGVYGTIGVSAPPNVPGARVAATGWVDKNDNLWLFGGWGYDSGQILGMLDDLWEFDTKTHQWVWMGGNSVLPNNNDSCWPGAYGTRGVSSSQNQPGGRQGAAGWSDQSGNFWLFAGGGCDADSTQGLLNDLWKFNPANLEWTWIGGASTVQYVAGGSAGVYGTLGTAAAQNTPGGRWFPTYIGNDKHGDAWLFGGDGFDATDRRGLLNDLWQFNAETMDWTWQSGSSSVPQSSSPWETSQPGIYGTLGQFAAANVPGGRGGAVGSIDAKGNLWLFGGASQNPSGFAILWNDLWEFIPSLGQWAWMSGNDIPVCLTQDKTGTCITYGGQDVYGNLGVPASANTPGGRSGGVSWTDTTGQLWIFGGDAIGADGNVLPINDLWRYNVKQSSTVTLTSSPNPVFFSNTVMLTATVAGGATGSVGFFQGTASLGTGTLSASGIATLTTSTLAVGTDTLTAMYGGDANYLAGSATMTELVEDFSLTAPYSTNPTLSPGGSTQYTFVISPAAPATTFPSGIALSASGGPLGASYSFSSATVASGAGVTRLLLTIAIPATVALAPAKNQPASFPPRTILLAAALLAFLPVGRRRCKRFGSPGAYCLLLLISGVSAATWLSGCGGARTPIITQPQSYTITVTGTSGLLSHSASSTLSVN